MPASDRRFSVFIFQLIVRIFFGTIVHEGCHLLGAALVNVQAAYYAGDFNHVHILSQIPPGPIPHLAVYISGGIGAAIFFLFINLEQEDPENNMANWFNGLTHFIYSIGEATLPSIYWDHAALIGSLVGGSAVIALLLWKAREWRI